MKQDIRIGQKVYWNVANQRISGILVEVHDQTSATHFAIRHGKEEDRVFVIKLANGRTVMKLESDIHVEK